MAIKQISDVLSVQVSIPADDAAQAGQLVELSGNDNEVQLLQTDASTLILGTLDKRILNERGFKGNQADTLCSVTTNFRARRDDRVSSEGTVPGLFVFDAVGKVKNFDPETHSGAAVRGLVLTNTDGADEPVITLEY